MNFEDLPHIKVDICEEGDIIRCSVEVPAPCAIFPYRVYIDTCQIEELLKRRAIKHGEVIEGTHINNKSGLSRLHGTWRFRSAKSITRAAPKRRPTSTRTRKTKKTNPGK